VDHIILNLNGYIDLCINTELVHDLYLNIMEAHFSMINCEKVSCKSLYNIFFFINKFLQVATLARAMVVSPYGFYHVKTSMC
jgi:hypothetical protein